MGEIIQVVGGSLGTNCYIVTSNDNKAVLIDFVPEAMDFINKKKIEVEKLFLTHIHFDHIEGLSLFQKECNFEFCLSEEALYFLKNPKKEILYFFPPEVIEDIKKINFDNAKVCRDNDKIPWDDSSITVLKSPGHSPDCLVFIFDKLKSVFSGDTLFYGSVGRTDLPGGNFSELERSIKNLYSKAGDDYFVYPGHGPKTSIGFEKKNNPFVTE